MSSTEDFRVFTFHDILRTGGIDPDVASVKLLRHIETRNRIDVHDVSSVVTPCRACCPSVKELHFAPRVGRWPRAR